MHQAIVREVQTFEEDGWKKQRVTIILPNIVTVIPSRQLADDQKYCQKDSAIQQPMDMNANAIDIDVDSCDFQIDGHDHLDSDITYSDDILAMNEVKASVTINLSHH